MDSYEDGFRVHPELYLSYKLVFGPCGVVCASKPERESENNDYGAFNFLLDKIQIKFRVAKTTLARVGQFVTLWKRVGKGPIAPYDLSDAVDVFVICVRQGNNFGQFVFSKSVLASENVLSKSGKGGKRAMRLYAPWVETENKQAAATQRWQVKHFINLSDFNSIDLDRARKLYGIK